MKNKILAVVLIGFLGIYLAPTLLANANNGQGQDYRVYPELKPIVAKNVELVKKMTVHGPFDEPKGKPTDKPGKPPKNEESSGSATGVLGGSVLGTRYAIVVGIANYPGTNYDLRYTDDDALEMHKALVEVYGYNEVNIYDFIDRDGENTINATRENIYNAVMGLKTNTELTADDEIVFFFSGHGMKGEAEDGDTELTDESIIVHDGTKLVPIWDGELEEWFRDFSTSRIIFIFDSCLAGGMTDLAKDGRIINMATTETGTAYEFSSLQNGQFSYYFVDEGMLQGRADVYDHNENGTLGEKTDVVVEESFDYAKKNYRKQDKRQGPTINDLFVNDLLL